jgi:hypothetical protein
MQIDLETISKYDKQLLKAIAMEKQQIELAYDYEADADMHDYSSGEQYYNQTYNL